MARPVPSGGSWGSLNPGLGLSWSHTADGSPLFVIIEGRDADTGNTEMEACTFGGVTLEPRFRWAGNAGVNDRAWYLFYLEEPEPGSDTIDFLSTMTTSWQGQAFNCPGAGEPVLIGAYFNIAITALARRGYGWDDQGVLICAAAATGAGITEGTSIVSSATMITKYINSTDSEQLFNASRSGSGVLSMMSFLIPPNNQKRSGGGWYPSFGGRISLSGLAVGDTTRCGLPYGGSGVALNSAVASTVPLPGAGTIRSLALTLSEALGSGNEITVSIERGLSGDGPWVGASFPVPTGISHTIGGTDTTSPLDGIDFSHYRYERLSLLITNTGAGTIPDPIYLMPSMLRESGRRNEQVYGGGALDFGSNSFDVEFRRAPLHPNSGTNWDTATDNSKSLVGIDAEVREAVYAYQEVTAADPDHDFFLQVNDVNQADTECSLVIDSMGQALARTQCDLSIEPGDFFAHVGVARTGSDTLRIAANCLIVPSTRGEILLSGTSRISAAGAPDFVALIGSSRDQSSTTLADESKLLQTLPPLTAAGVLFHARGARIAVENAGPGGTDEWAFFLRKNLADSGMAGVTITGAETEGQGDGDVTYDGGDSIGAFWDGTNGPFGLRQFWTIPGYLQPSSVIGPLAWVHWPRRLPGSPTEIVTDTYSDMDMQCPAEWENGFKEGLVIEWGEARRPSSHLFTGEWQGTTFSFQIADKQGRFRAQQGSLVDRYWTEPLTVRMTSRANRAELGRAFTVFCGPITEAQPTSPLLFDVTLGDVVSQGLLSDQAQVPWRKVSDGFLSELSAVSEHLDPDTPEPIIYGTHNRVVEDGVASPAPDTGFRIKPIYLGIMEVDGNDAHVWLVAGHACQSVRVYVDGDEQSSLLWAFGGAWLIPGQLAWTGVFGADLFLDKVSDTYGTIRRYTLIFGKEGAEHPDAAALGEEEILCDVEGIEDSGEGTGSLITDRFEQYKHFLINFVANQGQQSYQSGAWLENPTWDLFDLTVEKVDEDSFDDASDIAEDRLLGGYVGAAVIMLRTSVTALIANWNRSCACRFGITHDGQMRIFLLHPTQEDKDTAVLYTDAYEILDGSFGTELAWNEHATSIPFQTDYDHATGTFHTSGRVADQEAIENYGGKDIPSETREYSYAPGLDQAQHLAILELRIRKHRPRYIRLDGTIGADPVTEDSLGYRDIGDYIRYVCFEAIQADEQSPSGIREERLAQIIDPGVRVGPRRVNVIVMDVEDYIGYDQESSP